MDNTKPMYWMILGFRRSAAKTLAYIAGDYANMRDLDVIETYLNELAG